MKAQTDSDFLRAVSTGNDFQVREMLSNGTSVNTIDSGGFSALMYAAHYAHFEVAKLLIDNGADISVKSLDGTNALMSAAIGGNPNIIRILLDKGLSVNVKNLQGETALMCATAYGNFEVTKLLIDNGADISVKSSDGASALMSAAIGGNPDIIRILLDKGLSVNAKNLNGETALMFAAAYGNFEAIILLLENQADLNIKNSKGYTAASLATLYEKLTIAYLLEKMEKERAHTSKSMSYIAAKILVNDVNNLMQKTELPIKYSRIVVSVNNNNAKIKFEKLNFYDEENLEDIYVETIEIDLPYIEALTIASEVSDWSVSQMDILLSNIIYLNRNTDDEIKIDEISIDFTGSLNENIIENFDEFVPENNQTIKFTLSGININSPDLSGKQKIIRDLLKTFIASNKLSLVFSIDIDDKKISIEDFSYKSEDLSITGNIGMDYLLSINDEMIINKCTGDVEANLNSTGISWGDAFETGEFALDNFNLVLSTVVEFDEEENFKSIEYFKSGIILKNASFKTAGQMNQTLEETANEFGINTDLETIKIPVFAVNSNINDEILQMYDTEITTEYFQAHLKGSIHINFNDFNNSYIRDAVLHISNISPEFYPLISNIEKKLELKLPRKNDDLYFEIYGFLSDLRIKGLKY